MSKFLTQVFYRGESYIPTLRFSDATEFTPLDQVISISFDLSQRHCIGWHDLATGESHPCPEKATTDKKFETCPACQRRTGFNPAFYNTDKVSTKQEARNAEPHHLYLAYMGHGYIKVGISWHKRDIKRLLDQGARAGLIIETFPTALTARQYEDKIARIQGMHETTSTRTKLSLLTHQFNENTAKEQLLAAKQNAEEVLGVTFSGNDILLFDRFYTTSNVPFGDMTQMMEPRISGAVEALVGDILITRYDDRLLALPLKQFTGYQIELGDTITSLDLAPQQMQLF